MNENHPCNTLYYKTIDPQSPIENCPAMTSMLFKVCDKDQTKFEEATRIIGLFMEAAYEQGKTDASKEKTS